jgi:hypothetical protein
MSGAQWLAIIAQVGLEKAYLMYLTWQDKQEVTPEMWDILVKDATSPSIPELITAELARRGRVQ